MKVNKNTHRNVTAPVLDLIGEPLSSDAHAAPVVKLEADEFLRFKLQSDADHRAARAARAAKARREALIGKTPLASVFSALVVED
jgi:hypothetical protein